MLRSERGHFRSLGAGDGDDAAAGAEQNLAGGEGVSKEVTGWTEGAQAYRVASPRPLDAPGWGGGAGEPGE